MIPATNPPALADLSEADLLELLDDVEERAAAIEAQLYSSTLDRQRGTDLRRQLLDLEGRRDILNAELQDRGGYAYVLDEERL